MRQHRRHLLLHELLGALEFVLELVAPVTEEDDIAGVVVVDDVDDIQADDLAIFCGLIYLDLPFKLLVRVDNFVEAVRLAEDQSLLDGHRLSLVQWVIKLRLVDELFFSLCLVVNSVEVGRLAFFMLNAHKR